MFYPKFLHDAVDFYDVTLKSMYVVISTDVVNCICLLKITLQSYVDTCPQWNKMGGKYLF